MYFRDLAPTGVNMSVRLPAPNWRKCFAGLHFILILLSVVARQTTCPEISVLIANFFDNDFSI